MQIRFEGQAVEVVTEKEVDQKIEAAKEALRAEVVEALRWAGNKRTQLYEAKFGRDTVGENTCIIAADHLSKPKVEAVEFKITAETLATGAYTLRGEASDSRQRFAPNWIRDLNLCADLLDRLARGDVLDIDVHILKEKS